MNKTISIIIPVYNEEKNIPLLYNDIVRVWKNGVFDCEYEIIFVNDGSEDNSWEEIIRLANEDFSVMGLNLSRNFGHQYAIEAGLVEAKGDAVIMMDGDLQHPPAIIPLLISKWKEGYEIVNTKRIYSEHVPFFKKVTSRFFYSLLNKISDIKIEPGSADFRLLSKGTVNELRKFPERDKFYRGLVNWLGFKTVTVRYNAGNRVNGNSSYSFNKMLSFARTGITSFSMFPMKIIIFFGFGLLALGSLMFATMLYYRYFVSPDFFSGSAILAAFMIINNGIIVVMIGINSIYHINMFKEIKNRPNYIIKDRVNFS